VFDQPDKEPVHAQSRPGPRRPLNKHSRAASRTSKEQEILAFTVFPKRIWKQIWSNTTERLNQEIRRRTNVVGIFPNPDSIIRLVGAVLAEQHDEWAKQRRHFELDTLTPTRGVAGSGWSLGAAPEVGRSSVVPWLPGRGIDAARKAESTKVGSVGAKPTFIAKGMTQRISIYHLRFPKGTERTQSSRTCSSKHINAECCHDC
jgi:hypothetical protein